VAQTKTTQAEQDQDVINVLLRQHEQIRELFARVKRAKGERKQQTFDELRALLAAHETAEEMVVRPVTAQTAGREVADARNHEEDEANHELARLEKMDVASPEFDAAFEKFEKSVIRHANKEEREEFPKIRKGRSVEDRIRMGRVLIAVEKVGPTHPHPSTAGSPTAQWVAGPFAAMLDRARDAVTAAMRN
jgi:hemerythrin superfamily protein